MIERTKHQSTDAEEPTMGMQHDCNPDGLESTYKPSSPVYPDIPYATVSQDTRLLRSADVTETTASTQMGQNYSTPFRTKAATQPKSNSVVIIPRTKNILDLKRVARRSSKAATQKLVDRFGLVIQPESGNCLSEEVESSMDGAAAQTIWFQNFGSKDLDNSSGCDSSQAELDREEPVLFRRVRKAYSDGRLARLSRRAHDHLRKTSVF